MFPTRTVPQSVKDLQHLEVLLSDPTPQAVEVLSNLQGDLLILGVGGKMGPTLARMARRAFDQAGVKQEVIGVARFSEPGLQDSLNHAGIKTIVCDLLNPEQLSRLPDAPNVLSMFGMKFGSTGQEALTWAVNTYLPGMICEKFRRSRIVAFSTGNVYGLTPVALGGSLESDPLCPTGEYSFSTIGRERIYEYFSCKFAIPMAILRLNYACEMRYGILVDLGRKVLQGVPIDLNMGQFNVLWQADANAAALAAFAHLDSPPKIINLAGPELVSVRRVAEQFGNLMGRKVSFTGMETADAILSNGQLGHHLFGYPRVGVHQMVDWIADWLQRDQPIHNKPTHFETRDGTY